MVMYGSTFFFIQTVARPASHPGLWAASGRTPDTFNIAAGMATSGLVTTWLAELSGAEVGRLAQEAASLPPGSDGLVLLPYFAGERTPLFDPRARGTWLGLTLHHTRAHLYRSVLEGVAMGARHNFEAMAEAGAAPQRLVAVGGGTRGNLWTRITSDVTGIPQDIPATTIGASYGDARMAADACGIDTAGWNPVGERIEPDPAAGAVYEEVYGIYRRTYEALREDMRKRRARAMPARRRGRPRRARSAAARAARGRRRRRRRR
jgi:xylulokinase